MKTIRLIVMAAFLSLTVVIGYQVVFTLPEQSRITSISEQGINMSLQCYENSSAKVLDDQGRLNVLVWNIYKQNKPSWKSSLETLTQNTQLVLLQEASLTPELIDWIAHHQWFGSQVDAFKAFQTSAGVLNLSYDTPSKACAYTELEPWLRLPKSALYAVYPLSDGQQLAVVNIHAVNFTYGIKEYRRQLSVLANDLERHQGPMIVAGDFNSWSNERLAVMKQTFEHLALVEVRYQPDNRTQFMTGLALDHMFYRGLTLDTAEAPNSDASDHNPLLASFRIVRQ
ncbi:endonuclease/exonuclease/phosphatase family protein [Vibrio sp. JPW-9-11-11]|uniref:endonuclease/exonuclease/phosphatase family protein n=1 Tax=Vibrio sp. JPW-9-11-11 TaxID=1416532 RepID=UPI001593E7B0|nr:endonuclease/exonuclease/phosphatase family protein [Vibrio sp. JPW-9-11-11]NVD07303.1 endonuclease/exonuclease/phosphatase family protein [Vibrio sp. JPW-9-11-11]